MANRMGFFLLITINVYFAPECLGFQGTFYRLKSKALTSYNRTLGTLSKIGCAVECAIDRSCRSASYRQTTQECMMSELTSSEIDLYGHDDSFMEVFGKNDFSCAGKADGFYADPKDCHKFYRCVSHLLYGFSCSGTLVFNPAIQVCDWPENYPCTN